MLVHFGVHSSSNTRIHSVVAVFLPPTLHYCIRFIYVRCTKASISFRFCFVRFSFVHSHSSHVKFLLFTVGALCMRLADFCMCNICKTHLAIVQSSLPLLIFRKHHLPLSFPYAWGYFVPWMVVHYHVYAFDKQFMRKFCKISGRTWMVKLSNSNVTESRNA